MKDHVVEKKYQVKRPEEEEGVDMWMPVQWMSSTDKEEPKSSSCSPGNKKIKTGGMSPTYNPWNPVPASPTYNPWQ